MNKFQNFLSSVIFHLIAPLLPLVVEFMYTKDILARSMIMGASMYVILIGITSKSQFIFSISLISSILLAAAYGAENATASAFPLLNNLAFYDIIVVFILHAVERFYRHMSLSEPFFLFKTEGV